MKNFCNHCGDQIEVNRSRDKSKKYCSRKCAAKSSSDVPSRTCPVCEETFKAYVSNNGERKRYCSKKCSNKSRSKEHTRSCKQCGKDFVLENIAYEKRGDGKYCSVSCAQRKYNINLKYFQNINSSTKAYWLGFIYADGCNTGQELIIKLHRKDRSHLEKFKSDIKSEHPIKNIQNTHSKLSAFRISSQEICSHLSEKGCVKNKTKTITYPNNLPQKYDNDFIRGYFDGDGYVGMDGNNPEWMIYSGSESFITQTQNKLSKHNIQTRKARDGNSIYLSNPKVQIKKLHDFLYGSENRRLERKHSAFTNIVS